MQNYIDLTISVRDYGVGISEIDRDRLFTVFFETNDENKRKHNKISHGLGLHICKQIAVALGGDLDLDSDVKIGAKFDLNLLLEISLQYEIRVNRKKNKDLGNNRLNFYENLLSAADEKGYKGFMSSNEGESSLSYPSEILTSMSEG